MDNNESLPADPAMTSWEERTKKRFGLAGRIIIHFIGGGELSGTITDTLYEDGGTPIFLEVTRCDGSKIHVPWTAIVTYQKEK